MCRKAYGFQGWTWDKGSVFIAIEVFKWASEGSVCTLIINKKNHSFYRLNYYNRAVSIDAYSNVVNTVLPKLSIIASNQT